MKIEGEAGRSRPWCLMFFGRGRLMAHLDRRRGFGVGGGRGVFGRGGSRWDGGRRGGLAWGEIDFAGEEAARGFLATAVEIGHGEVLLELVHNNENLNETIGPRAGIRIKVNFILCTESPARP